MVDLMNFKQDSRYAYAVGRICALEKNLLGRDDLERMIEAEDMERVGRILAEAGYSPTIHLSDLFFLHDEMDALSQLIEHLSLDRSLGRFLLLRYDFHNLKVLLKGFFLGEETDHMLLKTGTIPLNVLKEAIGEGKFSLLPADVEQTVREAVREWEETEDLQRVDFFLDRRMHQLLLDLAKEIDSQFLVCYVEVSIDLFNIKAFFRSHALSDEDLLEKVILDGGKLKKGIFLDASSHPPENLSRTLALTPYHALVQKAVDSWKEKGDWSALEVLCDDYLLDFLQRTKYVALGPEPLVGYFHAKENELRSVRTILISRLNGLDRETIRERLLS